MRKALQISKMKCSYSEILQKFKRNLSSEVPQTYMNFLLGNNQVFSIKRCPISSSAFNVEGDLFPS